MKKSLTDISEAIIELFLFKKREDLPYYLVLIFGICGWYGVSLAIYAIHLMNI